MLFIGLYTLMMLDRVIYSVIYNISIYIYIGLYRVSGLENTHNSSEIACVAPEISVSIPPVPCVFLGIFCGLLYRDFSLDIYLCWY